MTPTTQIAAVRHWLTRIEARNPGTDLAAMANRLEADLILFEEQADRARAFVPTLAQWRAGLTVGVGR